MTHIFEHTGEYHALYRSLVTSQAAERIFRVAQDDLQTSLERGLARLEKNGRRLPAPPALAARYLAGGLIALLRYWLDSGMAESPAEMNERFQRLAAKGLSD